ncbi:cytochrome p450 [Aureococcus anophagefferens]|nr:cytochrome p450 [Aureococcus anophagefferens]
MRYILRGGAMNYDKGILAEILAPILGNGLIPADPDVWRRRRRVITPAFHKQWLASTLSLFDECTMELVDDLKARHATAEPAPLPATVDAWTAWKADDAQPRSLGAVDMEERFCSVSLDIIGRAVFDYDFGSAKAESPLVRAVYRCLIEAEKRTTAFIPFWLIPGAQFLPSQVAFKNDLDLLNAKLDELVAQAFEEQIDDDDMLEAGQEVTKASTERISLLRFLVTIRGRGVDGPARGDLMTMLVAGHETTAALLTWTLYELFHPSKRAAGHLERLRAEVDANFALRKSENRTATAYADVNPALWDEPESFDPTRWERKKEPGPDAPAGWRGYDPAKIPAQALYPTEQSADYAFLPFGAGNRRCVGDQFAILEATVMLTTLIREFDFEFALDDPSTLAPKTGLGGLPVADVGMRTGATIHTEHGLWMTAKPREHLRAAASPDHRRVQGFEEPDVYDGWHDGCADTNGDPNGGPDRTDGSGYDCGWYASEMGGGCGSRDDDDFTAGQMCCACGGGAGPELFRIVPDEEEDNKGKEDGDDEEEDGASAPVLDADEEEDGASAPKRAAIAILAAVVAAATL